MQNKLSTSSPIIANTMLAEVPAGLNDLAKAIHRNNIEKGFYEKPKNIGEMLCLIHSEVSEALEADRKGKYAGENAGSISLLNEVLDSAFFHAEFEEGFKNTFEDEMADIFIRVLDMCAFKGIDIVAHVTAKIRYNKSREKYHGKKY